MANKHLILSLKAFSLIEYDTQVDIMRAVFEAQSTAMQKKLMRPNNTVEEVMRLLDIPVWAAEVLHHTEAGEENE